MMKMPVKTLLTVGFAAVCGLVVTAIVTGPADAARRRTPPVVFTCVFEQPSDGNLNLSDDDFVDIKGLMPAGSDFVFFGVAYGPAGGAPAAEIDLSAALPAPASGGLTGIFVNSNGIITFGGGDNDFTPTFAEFLGGPPRIAALWNDLFPTDGAVHAEFLMFPDRLVVTWVGVPEFGLGGSNTFQVILFLATDHLEILYDGLTAMSGVVGISPGSDADAIGEEFFGGGDDFDLDGRCLGGKNIGGGAMRLELIP